MSEVFRMALSLSPFSADTFLSPYTYCANGMIARNREELQKLYMAYGATEMFARIATRRGVIHPKDGHGDRFSSLEEGLELCKIAAKLNIPMNPEIMCAYTYMDMDRQQAPNFVEYPEIVALQKGKGWEKLSLDEMKVVLQAYGTFVATEILKTGCYVENWNLGNEANFGFAGVSIGLKTAVNPKLERVKVWQRNVLPFIGTGWLKKNLWKYNALLMKALSEGIICGYKNLGMDYSKVKFSTHIATVVSNEKNAVQYFQTLQQYGFKLAVAGISFYPSAPCAYKNTMDMYKKIVSAIRTTCKVPVFIAEFAFPSGEVKGPYAGWNRPVQGYEFNQKGQASIYHDTIAWGKENGVIGIRYWAPDFKEWGTMSMFEYSANQAVAKEVLYVEVNNA